MYCNRCGNQFDHTYTNVCPSCGNVMDTTNYNQPDIASEQSYNPQQPIQNTSPDTSTTVLVWSIIGLAFAIYPYVSFLGIIFSCIARNKLKEYLQSHNNIYTGKIRTSNILSTIGLITSIVMSVIYVILFIAICAGVSIGLSNFYY